MNQPKNFSLVLFVSTLLVAVFIAASAGADLNERRNYVRLGVGVNQPTQDLDDAGYDADFFIGAVYGRYLAKYLVFEAGIHNFFADQEMRGSTSFGPYHREDSLSVFSIVGTMKGELPLGPVVLFAGAGAGGYYALLHSDIETYPFHDDFDENEDDVVFGVHVVAGGYYNINRRFFVGAEGIYRWTDKIDIEGHVFDIPIRLKGDLDGYAVTVMGGFRF